MPNPTLWCPSDIDQHTHKHRFYWRTLSDCMSLISSRSVGGWFFSSSSLHRQSRAALDALDDALHTTVLDAALCGNDMVHSVGKQMATLVEQARICELV